MPICVQLTPDQLASSLAAGWTFVGGPYPTSAVCIVNCGSAASSQPSSVSNLSGPFWCVQYATGNQPPCPNSGSACFAQSQLKTVNGGPFSPGEFVFWVSNGNLCFGMLVSQYADSTTCNAQCAGSVSSLPSISSAPPASLLSSESSKFGSGRWWCVNYYPSNESPCPMSGSSCFDEAKLTSVFGGTIGIGSFVEFNLGAGPCYGVVGAGPYPDPQACAPNCERFWCVAADANNPGICNPQQTGCFLESALTATQGIFQVTAPVSWVVQGTTCTGTIVSGPYKTAAQCVFACTGAPLSSVSSKSSTSQTSPGPVQTNCCPNAIPGTLTLTLSGFTGLCACLNGTVTLTYIGVTAFGPTWQGTSNVCGGTTIWNLYCSNSSTWTLFTDPSSACQWAGSTANSVQCQPVLFIFPVNSISCSNGCNLGNGTATVMQ